jgi:hypothetical protein
MIKSKKDLIRILVTDVTEHPDNSPAIKKQIEQYFYRYYLAMEEHEFLRHFQAHTTFTPRRLIKNRYVLER